MCVTFTGMGAGTAWTFQPRSGPDKIARPLCRLRINTAESAIDAAVAGIGLTNVLSYQIARPVAEGKLAVVLREYEPQPVPVHLVQTGQSIVPLKMRRFMEFASARLRRSLAADLAMLDGPGTGGAADPRPPS